MKALSITQPWAWLIAAGHKPVENRTWACTYRGRIAIHATKKRDDSEWAAACGLVAKHFPDLKFPYPQHLQYGAIIGVADLVDCVDRHDSPWFFGPYGFVLANSTPLISPVPCTGALGFWTVPDPVAAEVERMLE